MANQSDMCVSVETVSKKFSRSLKRSLLYGACDVARTIAGREADATLRKSEFWALKDVSFELQRGQVIGIIGLNGSGKTTLLRIITGILRPTLGTIRISGRIAPLLALGAGFKPVLSGRENIFLNLSLLGIAARDIHSRFDSIVDFAELGEVIDAPIGTYSSGLLARLGFACAVHTNPDILIVDEALSVGDAKFRVKCRNRINELRKNGTAMLLVSHSAITIQMLSDECVYLRGGRVAAQGRTVDVLKVYEEDTSGGAVNDGGTATPAHAPRKSIGGSQAIAIQNVRFSAVGTGKDGIWLTGKPAEMVVTTECLRALDEVSINIVIADPGGMSDQAVQFMMSHGDLGWLHLDAGRPELCLRLPTVGLRGGTYRVKISVSQGDMHDILDVRDDLKLVVRDDGLAANCLYFQQRDWEVAGGRVIGSPHAEEAPAFEAIEEF